MNIDKLHIARRFAKAGQTYNEHAVIQKKIAVHLMQLLTQQQQDLSFERVFEIGCGSGNLTQLYRAKFQTENIFLNDLNLQVQQYFQEDSVFQWCLGDAEQIEFPKDLNLIISSSALQWVGDLTQIFKKCAEALKPQGILCFSTFGQNNLKEIRALTQQGLDYIDLPDISDRLKEQGFEILHVSEYIQALPFHHPRDVLQHLKATGVTATASKFRWNKHSLAQYYHGYRQFIDTDEHENLFYPLSYHPIFVIARRVE